MQIAALVQKLQQFCWMCPGVTCISFLYYLSYKNYPPGSRQTSSERDHKQKLAQSSPKLPQSKTVSSPIRLFAGQVSLVAAALDGRRLSGGGGGEIIKVVNAPQSKCSNLDV